MVRVLVLVFAMTIAAVCYGQTEPTFASEQNVISASTLKRTYTTLPAWPESATDIEGWVLLRFTLLPDGTVTDVEVKEAHPAGIFEASAIEALKQWKFEPVKRDGKPVAQRAEIRMKYAQPIAKSE